MKTVKTICYVEEKEENLAIKPTFKIGQWVYRYKKVRIFDEIALRVYMDNGIEYIKME